MNRLTTGLAVLIVLIVALAGCALITKKIDPTAKIDQAVYSEAGGITALFTGRVSSCTVLRSNETLLEIVSFTFDEDTCSVELRKAEEAE